MRLHYHQAPDDQFRAHGYCVPLCNNGIVRDLDFVTNDADRVIDSGNGCKACQKHPEFPDNVRQAPWNRRMIDAGKEIRDILKKSRSETIDTATLRAVFDKHGL